LARNIALSEYYGAHAQAAFEQRLLLEGRQLDNFSEGISAPNRIGLAQILGKSSLTP
jgi:hypothetical protein